MSDVTTPSPRQTFPEAIARLTSQQIIRLLFSEPMAEAAQRATSSFRGTSPIAFAVPSETELRCRLFLERLRWPHGVRCPRCDDSRRICRIEERAQFECGSCGYQFSVRAGTILHASHLPLWKWLLAVYLMASADDITSYRLERTLGISYKTASHLTHTIRALTGDASDGVDTEGRVDWHCRRVRERVERGPIASLPRHADGPRTSGDRLLLVQLLSRLVDAGSGSSDRMVASA
ncbi:MAG: ISSod11, transposase [Actinomycetia bacterium]|jgi:transposase-like protein|nr:ISSod11, transposase [Actinomycetes bacterium]